MVADPVALADHELALDAEPVTEADALSDAAFEAEDAPEKDCDAVDVCVLA